MSWSWIQSKANMKFGLSSVQRHIGNDPYDTDATIYSRNSRVLYNKSGKHEYGNGALLLLRFVLKWLDTCSTNNTNKRTFRL